MPTDTIIVTGRTQASEDYTYTIKNVNPSAPNGYVKNAIQMLFNLSDNTILKIVRRHDADITNAT